MKNKFLIGVITFFVTIIITIIIFNFFESDYKKKYFFDRKFSKNNILIFDKKFKKMNISEYVMYVPSDNSIVEHDKKVQDESNNEYKFYFSDLEFKIKNKKNIILPKHSNVIFCDTNRLFFTNKYRLFVSDFENNISSEIALKNLKIFSLKTLNKTNFLCFAEFFVNNSYNTGFYIVDIKSKIITPSKILETSNNSLMPKNALAYSGSFSISSDKSLIGYSCDKYSKIYFFDVIGFFKKELVTNDKTPLPNILTNKQGDSFYGRGFTWGTNVGMFLKNDKIFVFSCRSENDFSIIIDEYSYKTTKYIQSHKLNYNNLNSKSIRNVFIENDRIIIGFEFNYASFTFSRYI